uniref:Junction adhesion molecule 2 n=1 Tax=Cricetulus griseus TaxID=10029 RepID=A0A8C2QHF0_CRIGR
MARSPQGLLLLLLLLHYLMVALDYHKANGLSASKDHYQEVTVIEYQEAILACKTPKKTASSRLEWKKLGRGVSLVYYQQALQGDFKDRAEMIDFNIRIKNVTRNDAGKYRCEVSAPSEQGQNLQEDTVMLEVLGKVHWFLIFCSVFVFQHPRWYPLS